MHHPANQVEFEDPNEVKRRQRWGIILLSLFSAAYAGFIVLCTFAYDWTAATTLFDIPLSIAYGIGLILLALAISIVYGRLSRSGRGTR
jgi:uncharacterized membrane protein (DUF485 family)